MNEPSSDEKMFAAIAHASGCIFWIVGPAVIWFLKKDSSSFVAYHAIQAAIYQVVAMVILVVLSVCTFGFGTLLYPVLWLPALFWAWKAYNGSPDGFPGIAQFGKTEQIS